MRQRRYDHYALEAPSTLVLHRPRNLQKLTNQQHKEFIWSYERLSRQTSPEQRCTIAIAPFPFSLVIRGTPAKGGCCVLEEVSSWSPSVAACGSVNSLNLNWRSY